MTKFSDENCLCNTCAHRPVCCYDSAFVDIQKTINMTEVSCGNGTNRTARICDIVWIKPIELVCDYYMPKESTEMKVNEYQFNALRTANKKLSDAEALLDGLMGLTGEAGEAIDILKKHLFQDHDLDVSHLEKELGDVAWYLAIASNALGLDLEEVFRTNIDKLKERYPEGFESERSVRRSADDI